MLETLCYDHLRRIIRPVYEHYQPLLLLRRQDRSEKYKGYMEDYYTAWWPDICNRRNSVQCAAREWFFSNGNTPVQYFLDSVYGTIEKAMDSTQTSEELFQQFLDWFDEKRGRFRMSFDIEECKTELLKSGKRPNSHGGVANLLKTLTKTMEKQGASIETIAKVQYTVCMKAGIYIPDEFIEDVAVALTCGEKGVCEE